MNESVRAYWDSILVDWDPAPEAVSLEHARATLARLYHVPPLELAGEGECDDCREPVKWRARVGQVRVCRRDATSRMIVRGRLR